MTEQNRPGIYHAGGRDYLSLYQYALHTAEVFILETRMITPVPDSFFPEIVPRPKDTSCYMTKKETEMGVKPAGTIEGQTRMKNEESFTV